VAFTYLKVKSAKYLCLLPVVLVLVLVLRIWSCLHHCSRSLQPCGSIDYLWLLLVIR